MPVIFGNFQKYDLGAGPGPLHCPLNQHRAHLIAALGGKDAEGDDLGLVGGTPPQNKTAGLFAGAAGGADLSRHARRAQQFHKFIRRPGPGKTGPMQFRQQTGVGGGTKHQMGPQSGRR